MFIIYHFVVFIVKEKIFFSSQSRNVHVIVKKKYYPGGEEFRGLRKLKQFPILILLRKRGRGYKHS